jgi:hypothetical protein
MITIEYFVNIKEELTCRCNHLLHTITMYWQNSFEYLRNPRVDQGYTVIGDTDTTYLSYEDPSDKLPMPWGNVKK